MRNEVDGDLQVRKNMEMEPNRKLGRWQERRSGAQEEIGRPRHHAGCIIKEPRLARSLKQTADEKTKQEGQKMS